MEGETYSPLSAPGEDQVRRDAALARSIAEMESAEIRAQADINRSIARERAWDAYYARQYPYYYGTWRAPPARPVVVYRDDPCMSYWFLFCFFFWLIILFVGIILLIYFTS